MSDMFKVIGVLATVALIFWLGDSIGTSGIMKLINEVRN